jgi:hypothetical protein
MVPDFVFSVSIFVVDFFLSPLFLSSLLFVLSSSWPGLDSSAGPWSLISFHAHQIRWHRPEFAVHVWILLLASVLLFFGLSHARSLQSPLIHFGRALGRTRSLPSSSAQAYRAAICGFAAGAADPAAASSVSR